MAVSYVSGSSAVLNTAASTTLTLTLPSGIQQNDLILIYAANGEDSPQPSVTTAPSGYTLRGSGTFLDYGAGGISGRLYWKIAGSSESSPTITWNTGAATGGGLFAVIVVYRGVNTSDPFDLASVSEGTSAAATTFAPPSVTTQSPGAWVVSFIQTGDNNANILNSGNEQGFTGRLTGSSFQTTTGSDAGFGVADKEIPFVGSVTLPTWEQSTVGADAWGYQTIAIKPASWSHTATPTALTELAAVNNPISAPSHRPWPQSASNNGGSGIYYDLWFDGTTYVAVGQSGTLMTATSPYGSFTTNTDTGFSTSNILGVVKQGSTWAIAGGLGRISTTTSPSGTWTLNNNTNTTAQLNDIVYGNGVWVAVGQGGVVITASDPTGTWTVNTSADTAFGSSNIRAVEYANGIWVATGASGKIGTATDPAGTWTVQQVGAGTELLEGLAYGDGVWVTTQSDAAGALYWATDPTGTWTAGITLDIQAGSAAYADGYWVVCGPTSYGRAFRSPVSGTSTASLTLNPTSASQYRVRNYNGVWMSVGASGTVSAYSATKVFGSVSRSQGALTRSASVPAATPEAGGTDATATPSAITRTASVTAPTTVSGTASYTTTAITRTASVPAPAAVSTNQIYFRSAGAIATDTQTLFVPAPSGLQVGDLELLYHHWNNRTAPTEVTNTTGWQVLSSDTVVDVDHFMVWWRIVPSGETTQAAWVAPSNFTNQRAVRVAYYSSQALTPTLIDTSSVDDGSSVATDSQTTDIGFLAVFASAQGVGSSDTWTPPGITERYNSGYSQWYPRIWAGDEIHGGGSTTSRSFSSSAGTRDMFTATVGIGYTVPDASVSPTAITRASSVAAPTSVFSSTSHTTTSITRAASVTAPTSVFGAVSYTTTAITRTAAVAAPTVSGAASYTTSAITRSATVHTATASGGSPDASVSPGALTRSATVGTATAVASASVTTSAITATTTLDAPSPEVPPVISVVGAASDNVGTGTSTSPRVTMPSGIENGDVAYMWVTTNTGSESYSSGSNWTGWAQVGNTEYNGTVHATTMFRKYCTGSEDGQSTGPNVSGSRRWSISVVVIRSGEIDQNVFSQRTSTTATTSVTFGSATPTADNALVVAFAATLGSGNAGTSYTFSPGGSYTEQTETCTSNATNLNNAMSINTLLLTGNSGVQQTPDALTTTADVGRWNNWTLTFTPSDRAQVQTFTNRRFASVPAPDVRYGYTPLITESFNNTDGVSVSTANTVFDTSTGLGASTFRSTPTPISGSTCVEINGSTFNRLWRETGTLPGPTNGGSALTRYYCRFYVRTSDATPTNGPVSMLRFDDAAGTTEAAAVRINTAGQFSVSDGGTSRGTTTRLISTTEWTRVEMMADQDNNVITGRFWWGDDLHSTSTAATNFEQLTGVLNSDTVIESLAFGLTTSGTAETSLFFDELAVATGGWIGPASLDDATASPGAITQTASVGAPTVETATNASVSPTAITRTAITNTATAAGSASYTTTAITRTAAVGTITFYRTASVSPAAITRTTTVGTATLSTGTTRTPGALTRTALVGAITFTSSVSVSQGALTRTASTPSSTPAGSSSVTTTAITRSASVGAITFSRTATATPSAVTRTASVGAASVSTSGNAAVTPGALTRTASVGSITFTSGVSVTPGALTRTASTPSSTPAGSVSISPAALTRTTTVYAPTFYSGVSVYRATVARPENLLAASVADVDSGWSGAGGTGTFGFNTTTPITGGSSYTVNVTGGTAPYYPAVSSSFVYGNFSSTGFAVGMTLRNDGAAAINVSVNVDLYIDAVWQTSQGAYGSGVVLQPGETRTIRGHVPGIPDCDQIRFIVRGPTSTPCVFTIDDAFIAIATNPATTYAPTVTPITYTTPGALTRAVAVGNTTVSGAASYSATALTRTATVGSASVTTQGNVSVTPTAITRTASLPAGSQSGAGQVTGNILTRTATVGTATARGYVAVTPGALTRTATTGTATVSGSALRAQGALTRTATVSAPSLSVGRTVAPGQISRAATVGAATFSSAVSVTPGATTKYGTVPLAVPVGYVAVTPGALTRNASVGTASVAAGGGINVSATTVSRTATVGTATAAASSTVAPGAITRTRTVGTITFSAAAGVTPGALTSTASTPSSTPAGSASVSAGALSRVASVSAPTITRGAGVTPGSLTRTASVGAPTVTTAGNAAVTAGALTRSAVVGTATLSTGSVVTVAALTRTATTPTAATFFRANPLPIQRTATTYTPSVASVTNINATALTRAATVPSGVPAGAARAVPGAISRTAAVYSPTPSGTSSVPAPGLSRSASVPGVLPAGFAQAGPTPVILSANIPSAIIQISAIVSAAALTLSGEAYGGTSVNALANGFTVTALIPTPTSSAGSVDAAPGAITVTATVGLVLTGGSIRVQASTVARYASVWPTDVNRVDSVDEIIIGKVEQAWELGLPRLGWKVERAQVSEYEFGMLEREAD